MHETSPAHVRGRRGILAAAVLAVAVVAITRITAAAAEPSTVIGVGHIDVLALRFEAGGLRIQVKDSTSPDGQIVWREPTDVRSFVGAGAELAVPDDPQFAFLGPAGSPIWVLPQIEDPALVWPGWDTNEIPPGTLAGDALQWQLTAVEGPGSFALFSTGEFGEPSVIFDPGDGLPDATTVPVNTHAHANWVFGATGTYRLHVRVDATLTDGTPVSDDAVLVFDVVDRSPDPTSTTAVGEPTSTSTADPGSSTSTTGVSSTSRPPAWTTTTRSGVGISTLVPPTTVPPSSPFGPQALTPAGSSGSESGTGPGRGSGALPATGAPLVGAAVTIGAVLACAGAALTAASRRRRDP